MNHEHPRQGEAGQPDLVAEAEAQVLRLGRKLAVIIERLEAGDMTVSGEVSVTVAALDKALGAVFSERARRARNGGNADIHGGQFDLVAARAEIGRRLDRLRAVAGAGAVSGGAE